MRGHSTIAAAALLAGLALAAPAAAQDYSYDAAWNAGAIVFGKLNSSGQVELKPATGWVVGLQADHWLGSGQVGLRFNGAYTRRPINLPEGRDRDLGIGLGDIGLLLRIVPVKPGVTVSPYVGVGGGFLYYGLGAGEPILFPTANARYNGGNHLEPAAVGTFGIDFLTGMRWDDDPVGIRVEASDHVARSPLKPIEGSSFSPVHNFRVVLGVFTGVGILR